MANVYSVDKHPQKENIIKDILSGKTNTEIAANYGQLSINAVRRYKEDVLLPELIKEHNQKIISDGLNDLIGRVQRLADGTEELCDGYRALLKKSGLSIENDYRDTARIYLSCCKELRESVKDLASYRTGNIPTSNEITVNVNTSPITVSQIAAVFEKIEDDALRIELLEDLQKLQQ